MKNDSEPSAEEMKKFASNYDSLKWEKLTHNKVFLSIFDKNLDTAKTAADMILSGKTVTKLKDVTGK